MKGDTGRIIDGNRQRCTVCGHPRVEHHSKECAVPRCPCTDYSQPGQTSSS